MPYVKRQASIVNGADNGGGGMKKAGLVYRTDFRRVNQNYLKRNTPHNLVFRVRGTTVY
jgi:hypothetical protein